MVTGGTLGLYRWLNKPKFGTKLNQVHPLITTLLGFWAINEGAGNTLIDAASNMNLIASTNYGSNNPWAASSLGPTILSNGAGRGFQATLSPFQYVSLPLTFVSAFTYLGSPAGSYPSWGTLLQTNNASCGFVSQATAGQPNLYCSTTTNSHCALGTTFVAGKTYVIGGTITPQGLYAYTNGSLTGSLIYSCYTLPYTSLPTRYILGSTQGSAAYANSAFLWSGWWQGEWSAATHALIGSDPNAIWQIFEPQIDISSIMQKAAFQGGRIYNIPISFDTSTGLVINPAAIYRPILLIAEQTDLNSFAIRESSINSSISESTDISQTNAGSVRQQTVSFDSQTNITTKVIRDSQIIISLNGVADSNQSVVRDSAIYNSLNQSTDINTTAIRLIDRSQSFDISVILSSLTIRGSQIIQGMAEQTDLSSSVVLIAPSTAEMANLDVATTLSVSAGNITKSSLTVDSRVDLLDTVYRERYVNININEQTDTNGTVISASLRSAGFDMQTDLIDMIVRASYEYVAIAAQTDLNISYSVSSPTQSISDSLDVSASLNISPGVISSRTISINEQTDINLQTVRKYNTNKNIDSITDLNSLSVNASARTVGMAEQTDLSIMTGRFRGESVNFAAVADLSLVAIGSTGAKATGENFDVQVDVNAGVVRTSRAGSTFDITTNLSLYTLRGSVISSTIVSDSVVDVKTGRQFYTISQFDVETDLFGRTSAIYGPHIDFNIDDSLTVLVNVGGAVIPIQNINFILTSINKLNFTLTSINQVNFTLN